jgi:hypothetical protein
VNIVKRGLLHFSGLVTVILLLGVVVGGIAGLTASSAQAAGALNASWYLALAVLLPLGLWAIAATFIDQDEDLYEGWGGALGIPLIAGVLGALFAYLGYVWAAAFGASLVTMGKLDAYAVIVATQAHLSGLMFGAALAATVVGAVLVGVWSHWRANAIPNT